MNIPGRAAITKGRNPDEHILSNSSRSLPSFPAPNSVRVIIVSSAMSGGPQRYASAVAALSSCRSGSGLSRAPIDCSVRLFFRTSGTLASRSFLDLFQALTSPRNRFAEALQRANLYLH